MFAEPLINIRHPDPGVAKVAYSPDGTRLATGGEAAYLWDTGSAQIVATLGGHETAVASLAFFPGGRTLVTADFGSIRLWDVASASPLGAVAAHTGWVYRAVVSPDGATIASVGLDNHVRLWDAATLKEIAARRLNNPTESVAFTPDGKHLAVAIGPAITIVDAATLGEDRPLGRHRYQAHLLSFSPDGKRLASGSYDAVVKVWDVEAGRELHVLKGHKLRMGCVAFSPDGRLIASGAHEAAVRLWDPVTGESLAVLKFPETSIGGAAFSPDGRTLAAVGGQTLRLWTL
jgi:WD40 repeat protein